MEEIRLIIAEENIPPIQQPPLNTFSVGIHNPTSFTNRKRKTSYNNANNNNNSNNNTNNNSKTNKRRKCAHGSKPMPPLEEPSITDLVKQINDIIHMFDINHNPYYVAVRTNHYTLNKNASVFKVQQSSPNHIKIIIPKVQKTLVEFFGHLFICYKTGTFFDWQVFLGELDIGGTFFDYSKSKFKINNFKSINNGDVCKIAEATFYENQWFRWQMKRLVCSWLAKKSKRRIIGEDCDLISGMPIPLKDQIRIISIKNRTEYVFSGQDLVKTAKCCLENQVGAIPALKPPHNPYTNTPFTYGEMITMYFGILSWCAQNGKTMPSVITLYRESRFRSQLLIRINNNYLQLKAVETYILNDDVSGEFFIEAMELLLEDFADPLYVEYDSLLIGYQRFRLWNQIEPKNPLLVTWKKLAAHYWYYKQTELFARETWRSESSIYIDICILMKASLEKLKYIGKEYYRRRISAPVNNMP